VSSDGSYHALSSIEPGAREALISTAGRRRYRRHETLVHAGDEGNTLFLVETGHAAVRIVTEYGDTTTFAVLGPGDSFGELALLSDEHLRSASVVALEDLTALTLSRARLEATLGRAGVHGLLVQVLANQVHRLSGQLVEARFVPVRHRVARALVALFDQYPPDGGRVSLLVTQDDIAGLAGTTRPTVNEVLRTLELAGAIELHRGRVDVIDEAILLRHRG
jgi:CRP/FNR family cyclic AMP-dependent transcriptional regulator